MPEHDADRCDDSGCDDPGHGENDAPCGNCGAIAVAACDDCNADLCYDCADPACILCVMREVA